MTTVREEMEEIARLHFQKRAEETRALAQSGTFRSRREQLLELARRYEALTHLPEQRPAQSAPWMRRTLR